MAKRHKHKPATPVQPSKSPIFGVLSVVRKWAPVLVGLAYLAIMLPIALHYHKVGNYRLETDFFWSYAPQARLLLQDGALPIEDFRGPVYPVVLAGASYVLGDYFRAGILISLISAALILGILYAVVSRLWSPAIAMWAAGLTAVNPIFVRYSYEAGTDLIFAAIGFASIYFIMRDKGIRGGILAGVAYLTRFNGVSLLVGGMFNRKRLWILGAFLLMILPWGIRCAIEKGDFFYNKNYLNLAYNLYAEGTTTGHDDFWWDPKTFEKYTSFASVVLADPVHFAAKMIRNVWTHAEQDATDVIGIPQGLLALLGAILLRPNRKQLQFMLFGILMFGVNLLAFYADRFSLYLIPFYALLAVIGCERLLGLLGKYFRASHAKTSGAGRARTEPVS